MNVREKISMENKLKNLKRKSTENSYRIAQSLELQLNKNREKHPEPAPNSLISGIKN